ncbi:unnamed protein product, partial [Porites evermanni]
PKLRGQPAHYLEHDELTAVKQFNEGVSQVEVEHEANIISSFNEAKPFTLNGDDAKKVAQNSKEGMTPFIIFEGQPQAPDDIYLSGESNLLLKVNGGHTSA